MCINKNMGWVNIFNGRRMVGNIGHTGINYISKNIQSMQSVKLFLMEIMHEKRFKYVLRKYWRLS